MLFGEDCADESENEQLVKFYFVAMLFPVFDVEAVFVYPWAVVLRELGWTGFWQMVAFLDILGVAFVDEIGRGGLEWDITDDNHFSPVLTGLIPMMLNRYHSTVPASCPWLARAE